MNIIMKNAQRTRRMAVKNVAMPATEEQRYHQRETVTIPMYPHEEQTEFHTEYSDGNRPPVPARLPAGQTGDGDRPLRPRWRK